MGGQTSLIYTNKWYIIEGEVGYNAGERKDAPY